MTKNTVIVEENMTKVLDLEASDDTDSDSEPEVLTKKKGKEKKPYVNTEARKAAFEKTLIIRAERVAARKEAKLKENDEFNTIKQEKQVIKDRKKAKKQALELKALETSDESSEDEIIIKKKKKKSNKKKIVYVNNDSDSEDEKDNRNVIIINNKMDKPDNKPKPPMRSTVFL